MELGPVELVVLTFPGERADPDVVGAVAKVVSQGYVTVLDLVFISRLQDGQIRITDVDENLDDIGFGSLEIKAQTLVNEDDMEVICDSLEPGKSARSSCTRGAGPAAWPAPCGRPAARLHCTCRYRVMQWTLPSPQRPPRIDDSERARCDDEVGRVCSPPSVGRQWSPELRPRPR